MIGEMKIRVITKNMVTCCHPYFSDHGCDYHAKGWVSLSLSIFIYLFIWNNVIYKNFYCNTKYKVKSNNYTQENICLLQIIFRV